MILFHNKVQISLNRIFSYGHKAFLFAFEIANVAKNEESQPMTDSRDAENLAQKNGHLRDGQKKRTLHYGNVRFN